MTVNEWAPWVGFAISIATLLYTIFNGRSKKIDERFVAVETKVDTKASKDHVSSLDGRLDIVEDKVTIIQNDLRHLPDKDVTHRLELVIGELRSEVGTLTERMKPISQMASRMQEAILEKVMS